MALCPRHRGRTFSGAAERTSKRDIGAPFVARSGDGAMDKNKTMAGRRALLEAAARFRMEAALTGDARSETSSEGDFVRGHAGDDSMGVAQNVRSMNCAGVGGGGARGAGGAVIVGEFRRRHDAAALAMCVRA